MQLLAKASEKYLLVSENKRLVKELEKDIKKRKRLEAILVRRDMVLAEVADMAVELLLNNDWQSYIKGLLNRLGLVMAVSKIRVFEHHNDEHNELWANLKLEWVSEHIPALSKGSGLDNFSYRKLQLERWITSFQQGDIISGNSGDFPKVEASWLDSNQIKSIVSTPILTGKDCWGFISFEDHSVERNWARPELDALKTTATLLGTAILRQKMESDIADHQVQLAHAGRLTALGEMASGIGHEIHQPLSVINLNAEICQSYLAKHDPDFQVEEASGAITRQVSKIARLIDNLRLFSRMSSGQLENISLNLPVEKALAFFREQFRLSNIELEIKICDNLPLAKTDCQKFEQIMVNFLSNAKHAVDTRKENEPDLQKKIAILLDYKNLNNEELAKLTFRKNKNSFNQVIHVEVQDNGVGMDDLTQKRCLEPFYTTKAVGEGTGLGLSVSHGIIQELNLHLEIESQQGEGTIFRLYIPVEKEVQA